MNKEEYEEIIRELEHCLIYPHSHKLPKKIKPKGYVPTFRFIKGDEK